MNRRKFFNSVMESATGLMACSGLAMFAIGRGISRGPVEKPDTRYIESGYSLWIWKRVSKDGKHSWCELLETIVYPDGAIYTRPYDSAEFFRLALITRYFYPLWRTFVETNTVTKRTRTVWKPVFLDKSIVDDVTVSEIVNRALTGV